MRRKQLLSECTNASADYLGRALSLQKDILLYRLAEFGEDGYDFLKEQGIGSDYVKRSIDKVSFSLPLKVIRRGDVDLSSRVPGQSS